MKRFYDFDKATRVAMTKAVIAERRTLRERWTALDGSESRGWSERSALAASFLSGHSAVIDLGCGLMSLERYLTPSVKYIPVDVEERDHRTVVVDLNRDPLPILAADAVAALALLEYIFDVSDLIEAIAATYRYLIVSYNCVSVATDLETRFSYAWVSALSQQDMETLFRANRFKILRVRQVREWESLWHLEQQP